MAIINVTLGSRPTDHVVPVSAGPDTVTFCEITALLSATLLEPSRPGDTFLWEQVLRHQYTSVNRTNNTITASGNLLSTFYSSREIINVYVGFETVETLSVTSVLFNGVDTVLTIKDPIPPTVLLVGVFEHAGSAVDGTFTWNTPTDELNAIVTPLTFTNKRFRFWSNRGKRSQRYDDVNLILIPEDTYAETSAQLDNMYNSGANACRKATASISPSVPMAVNQCTGGSGNQIINPVTNWSASWIAPACDTSNVVGYIAQQSCNGGDTWTTISTTNHIQELSIPPGCAFRVLTLFNLRASHTTLSPVWQTTIQSFVIVPSNTVSAFMRYDWLDAALLSSFDTMCSTHSLPLNPAPLSEFQVSGVVILTSSDDSYSSISQNNANLNLIPAFQTSGIVMLTPITDGALNDLTPASAYGQLDVMDFITFFQASGSVTIGG